MKTFRRVGFKTSDGITLLADVHAPVGLTKTPTILTRIPFSLTFMNRLRSDVIGRFWASRGYTVVVQGTRGRYESGGTFYPLIHERQDGIETLRWIARQPWFDGRLAMWGGSAFGHTQWAVADQTNPGPNAYFIQIASSDFRRAFRPGGAFALETALYWALLSHGQRDQEVKLADLDRGVAGLPVIQADDRAWGDVGFFDDWARNGANSPYWARIDGLDRVDQVAAPVLLLGGWFDPFTPAMLDDFRRLSAAPPGSARRESRIIVGPYAHARTIGWHGDDLKMPYRQASVAPALAWFDHHLGITNTPLGMPRVKLFVMGENVWRNENEWPLARTRYTPLFLAGGAGRLGALSSSPTTKGAEAVRFAYDPRQPVPTAGGAMLGPRAGMQRQNAVEARGDVLLFDTPALRAPLEVTGPIRCILYVSTDAPSTDFTAKLVDVRPDGRAYNISDGIVRQAFAPGQPTRVEIELAPTSMVFGAGHRIRLEVSSSNHPLYDRNPNTGESAETATVTRVAHQTVLHGVRFPSELILPIIPTGGSGAQAAVDMR